ncbi:KAP family P-loop NTPase fold protein [Vagococcus jeotgali]|uniref:KAP family P-loop NTPase fold protein n=1 Tax=Vagococcus jeotgali TaxID=3109030 RepID=UPI002DDBB564|nr:P-loop NTPase fold protein [Vagococcus sp. B2T-5]
MQRLDIEYNVDEIKRLLSIDSLNRNKNLEVMMRFLDNLNSQMVLNLDDGWGTGKTVFLKQLEYLGNINEINENIVNLDKKVINSFKSKYNVFYFNAWEHDLYDNPLESLIYSLLMKMASIEDNEKIQGEMVKVITKTLKKIGILSANTMVKIITNGSIEIKDLVSNDEDPIPKITSIEKKREAINELLEGLLGDSNEKILIIIDELDRCKPSYAVKLLEVVKHFFINDQIVFLFGSNKKELSETVKHEYGNNFDGYKYLNRFFDFEFTLPKIDRKIYAQNKIGNKMTHNDVRYKEALIVIEYFNFSMRDINRFFILFDNIIPYLKRNNNDYYKVDPTVKYLMLLYSIGLRIHSGEEYKMFIGGQGMNGLIDFYEFRKEDHDYIIIWDGHRTEIDAVGKLTTIYDSIKSVDSTNEYNLSDIQHSFKEMFEVLTMMSNI